MTAHNDLDRQLTDFLKDGPEELPYQSFDAVRDRMDQTGQRVVIGPWRLPEMNKIVTIGLGAAAVVLAVIVGIQFFGTPRGGTGGPGDEPSATSEPTATLEPSPSDAAAPPLTQSFTSTLHGYSVSYPEGWATAAATEPWTTPTFALNCEGSDVDVLYLPDRPCGLFLIIASQPIGDSAPEDWVREQLQSEEGCSSTSEFDFDGATGRIGDFDCTVAVVALDGRGYWIQLYTGDEAPETYDAAWFEKVLATVQLSPEDAVDAEASAAP